MTACIFAVVDYGTPVAEDIISNLVKNFSKSRWRIMPLVYFFLLFFILVTVYVNCSNVKISALSKKNNAFTAN